MGDIIVGVDGSDSSRAALRWAARTATATATGLRAVGAWQYPAAAATPAGPATLPASDDMDRRTCDDLRAVVREELGAEADRVDVEAGRGPAAPVLLGAARAGADMLVVGARGLGGYAARVDLAQWCAPIERRGVAARPIAVVPSLDSNS